MHPKFYALVTGHLEGCSPYTSLKTGEITNQPFLLSSLGRKAIWTRCKICKEAKVETLATIEAKQIAHLASRLRELGGQVGLLAIIYIRQFCNSIFYSRPKNDVVLDSKMRYYGF